MTKTTFQFFVVIVFALIFPGNVLAGKSSPQSGFLFGNHIDSHQSSHIVGNGDLRGVLKVTFTGEYDENGMPIATHCKDDTDPKDCVAGWKFVGKSGMATMLYHHMDHPVWLVADRADIPQPGAFTHFHWVAQGHSHEMASSGDHDMPPSMGCNVHSAMDLAPGVMCHGYFLELFAVRHFVFKHHMDMMPISPGIDTTTHTNIVASAPHDHGGGDGGGDHGGGDGGGDHGGDNGGGDSGGDTGGDGGHEH